MDISWGTAVLCVVLLYLIYWLFWKQTNYWKEYGVPHAKSLPVVGSMKDVLMQRVNIIEFVVKKYKEFDGEKYFGFDLFNKPVLVIRDIELINAVLIKDFIHFEDRQIATDENLELMNASVSNLCGERWRVLRHKMTPSFSSGKMKMMFNKIKECSEEASLYLKEKNGKDIDSRDFLFKYMINVIGEVAFGLKVDAFNNEKDNPFLDASRRFFKPSSYLQFVFLLSMALPELKQFFRIKLMDSSVDNFFLKLARDSIEHREQNGIKRHDFLQLLIDERDKELEIIRTGSSVGAELKTKMSKNNENSSVDDYEEKELLEHLKNVNFDENYRVFTDNIIAAQTFIFVSGGTETTAATLSFVLYELAENKDVQKQLQDEIDDIIASQGFNYDAVKKMIYMDQVLNEVLRLRPLGGILARMCTKDYKLPGTDLILKKGDLIQIPVLGIHKDPQYFPNPEKFDPSRFENMDQIPKGVFFPFGAGPRICIAMRLALLKMKVFLASILSSYTVVLSKKTKTPLKMDKRSLAQHVEGGLWLQFQERNRKKIYKEGF